MILRFDRGKKKKSTNRVLDIPTATFGFTIRYLDTMTRAAVLPNSFGPQSSRDFAFGSKGFLLQMLA
jgi:hypothetical protein